MHALLDRGNAVLGDLEYITFGMMLSSVRIVRKSGRPSDD